MKKLNLEFAGWLWAINHDREKEYYAENYGFHTEFTIDIGGQIVSQFFYAEPQLLAIAYRQLNLDWMVNIISTYPEKYQPHTVIDKIEVNNHEISWLLFHALSFNIELKTIDEMVEGDYIALWKQLNKKFPDESVIKEEKK